MRPSLAVAAVSLLLALTVSAEAGPEYFPIRPVSEKGEMLIVASDARTEFSLDGKSWSPAVPTATCTCWATLPGALAHDRHLCGRSQIRRERDHRAGGQLSLLLDAAGSNPAGIVFSLAATRPDSPSE